jgi:hypothetical protein
LQCHEKTYVNKVHNFHPYLAWVLPHGCIFALERLFFGDFKIYFGSTNGLYRKLLKDYLNFFKGKPWNLVGYVHLLIKGPIGRYLMNIYRVIYGVI